MKSKLPSSTFVREHRHIDLTCESDGWLRANITWYKNNVQLPLDKNKYSIKNSEVRVTTIRSVLTVFNVSRDEEADTYMCAVQSNAGALNDSTQLVVICKFIVSVLYHKAW